METSHEALKQQLEAELKDAQVSRVEAKDTIANWPLVLWFTESL